MKWARTMVLTSAAMGVSIGSSAQAPSMAEVQASGTSIQELNHFYCGSSQEPRSVIEIAKLIPGVTAVAATTPSGTEGVVWFVRLPSTDAEDHEGFFSRGVPASQPSRGVFVASSKGYCHVGFWRKDDRSQVLIGHYPDL